MIMLFRRRQIHFPIELQSGEKEITSHVHSKEVIWVPGSEPFFW